MSIFWSHDRCLSLENICCFLMLHCRRMTLECKYYQIQRGSHTTLATGWTCWHGTLMPSENWRRSLPALHMLWLLDQYFFVQFVVIFQTFYLYHTRNTLITLQEKLIFQSRCHLIRPTRICTISIWQLKLITTVPLWCGIRQPVFTLR